MQNTQSTFQRIAHRCAFPQCLERARFFLSLQTLTFCKIRKSPSRLLSDYEWIVFSKGPTYSWPKHRPFSSPLGNLLFLVFFLVFLGRDVPIMLRDCTYLAWDWDQIVVPCASCPHQTPYSRYHGYRECADHIRNYASISCSFHFPNNLWTPSKCPLHPQNCRLPTLVHFRNLHQDRQRQMHKSLNLCQQVTLFWDRFQSSQCPKQPLVQDIILKLLLLAERLWYCAQL